MYDSKACFFLGGRGGVVVVVRGSALSRHDP